MNTEWGGGAETNVGTDVEARAVFWGGRSQSAGVDDFIDKKINGFLFINQ